MKIILIIIVFFMTAQPVLSDCIYFEPNNFKEKNQIYWTGRLTKIDSSSKLAFITYQFFGETKEFQVHITRIYSFEANDPDKVNKPFRIPLEGLKKPLPVDDSREVLVLKNVPRVKQIIPEGVPVISGGNLTLDGTVVMMDKNKFLLKASTQNNETKEFEITRDDILFWIRGRR